VTSIGEYAFSGCTGLTSVTIPNSVISIGQSAFSWCTGLTSVTIGNSVASIGSRAFVSCTGLTSVTIPNSVTSIGGDAFRGCSGLTSVTIPNSVTSIGQYAFRECPNLTSVICLGVIPLNFPPDFRVFGSWENGQEKMTSACLYVPQPAIAAYRSTNVWKDFSCIEAVTGALSVTFSPQGGGAVSTQYALSGYKVTRPANPARSGNSFGGWYKDAECTAPWDFEADVVTSDITLFAKWVPLHTVTFDSQGGGNEKPQSTGGGEKVTAPFDPGRTGYFFRGWYKDAECTDPWGFDTDVVASDTTV
jgi:uncharacterized repeat protein (TIGR02543 family)